VTIRARLLCWLLPGFLVLWLGAGGAMYAVVKQMRLQELDNELRAAIGSVRQLTAPPRARMRRPPDHLDPAHDPTNGVYFQVWNDSGETVGRSRNLGGDDLPQPPEFSRTALFTNFSLAGGVPVRGMAVRSRGHGPNFGLNYLVARDRADMESELSRLLLGIVGGCVAGPVCFSAVLILALRSGLRPLRRLGEQAARIDAGNLRERFPTDHLPGEMEPIVGRLNELMHRLEQSFERERRFSGDLAHEMRTPLAAIRSTSEVAAKWPDQVTGEEHGEIAATAARLQRTVDSLLQLARTEKAAAETVREPVALNDLVARCLEALNGSVARSEISVRNLLPPATRVEAQPDLLATIVSNLLANAVEYSPRGGEVRIESGTDDCWLRISNSAPDLSAEDLPHLFDRLWRRDSARSSAEHSGLGLPLARSCAEVLGLSIHVRLDDEHVVHFSLGKAA